MHAIKGNWMDNGYVGRADKLIVEKNGNGNWRLAESGDPIKAVEYQVAKGVTGIEITSPNGVWAFSPSKGECERVGLPIHSIRDQERQRQVGNARVTASTGPGKTFMLPGKSRSPDIER